MRSIVFKWFLVSLVAAAGLGKLVAQKKDEPRPPLKYSISLGTGIQYWLHIFSDGSGTVGYGAGGSYQGYFKTGIFNVEQVTKQLKELPIDKNGDWRTHYYFAFESERKGPGEPGPRYYTSDRKLISSLFEKAIKASGLNKDYFPKGFGELKKSPGDCK